MLMNLQCKRAKDLVRDEEFYLNNKIYKRLLDNNIMEIVKMNKVWAKEVETQKEIRLEPEHIVITDEYILTKLID